MKCNVYRPTIFDSRGNVRERVSVLAVKTRMPKNILEKRIFKTGLRVIEKNLEQGSFDALFSDELRSLNDNQQNED
jgi:hypothetical protein